MSALALSAAWAEAGGTWAAVVAAVVAAVFAVKAYRRERDRDDAREQERHAAQAERIAAWCGVYDFSPPEPSSAYRGVAAIGFYPGKPEPVWHYYLRNASHAPVYELVLYFQLGQRPVGTDRLDVLPPGDEPLVCEIPDRIRPEARSAAAEHGQDMRVHFSFQDAAGQRWTRTLDGRLVQDGHPAPSRPTWSRRLAVRLRSGLGPLSAAARRARSSRR